MHIGRSFVNTVVGRFVAVQVNIENDERCDCSGDQVDLQ